MTAVITSAQPAASDEPRFKLSLTVNGQAVERWVPVRMLLSDLLRYELGLTGTHVGCEQGVCGACTVLIDGRTARACLALAAQVDGCRIRTIESVAASDGTLHPIQQAFQDCHALQCGFCTPGVIMTVLSHFEESSRLDLSDDAVRRMLAGHLCRCTGYLNIIAAVRRAARLLGREAIEQTEVPK
ncbi:(2Fe-2S)-binding protein [Paraherbaspirillum soli]|uniref:(2Fe-2S)-binding protein n=1 Tax=Paraherbaspirillum soli TaxID=631222 RepID=A0ABW0M9J8_9BURK